MKIKKAEISKVETQYDDAIEDIKNRFEDKVIKIQQGDDLLPTVTRS